MATTLSGVRMSSVGMEDKCPGIHTLENDELKKKKRFFSLLYFVIGFILNIRN